MNWWCFFGVHDGKWEIATATYTELLIRGGTEDREVNARRCERRVVVEVSPIR